MATARSARALGFVSLILIAGSLLLIFLVILSGVKDRTPLDKIYFLQADTSSFTGSGRSLSQWTYFYICGAGNSDCGKAVPALPFGYAWINGTQGVPAPFIGKHGHGTTSTYYYYMWRFGWTFYLIALVIDVFAFFTALLAPFSRLASGVSAFVLYLALFFMTLAAVLMTVTFVKARDVFKNAGITASLGKYAFGFTWAAWACILLAATLLILGCLSGRGNTSSGRRFGRRSRVSNRGSMIDSESQRRVVKDEYA